MYVVFLVFSFPRGFFRLCVCCDEKESSSSLDYFMSVGRFLVMMRKERKTNNPFLGKFLFCKTLSFFGFGFFF